MDLLAYYGPLPFNLDFFTELDNLVPICRYIGETIQSKEELNEDDQRNYNNLDHFDDENTDDIKDESTISQQKPSSLKQKHKRMSESLSEVLTDLGLVSFLPLNIEDVEVS